MGKRRTKATKTKQLGIRVDVETLDKIDAMATGLGLSRTQLVGRVLRDMVRMENATAEGGLFSEWTADLERMIEHAMNRAMREGGIDAVLHRAKEAQKATRKGAK